MSIKFIKYIFMILFICTTALFVQTSSSYAAGSCDGAYQPTDSEKDSGTTPNASGMFSDEIMKGMQEFMQRIYLHLSKPLMIGHSLMCYADKVAYHKIGYGDISLTFFNMNLFISGLLIYFVGVMMAMSIGMYFVDISFKLGFAMLFMPISIALWPFPPTKNKFQENLSIVIKNGMLFTLVAIGVAFAVTLISGSLFDEKYGSNGEKVFWDAIANKQTELLIESFAFDEFHFLVVAFGLIFAFKILASSVNDYLNYFFSDSVFGSESPMHHMGTQAIGMIKANTVDKAASFVGDVAKTQTGRAIAGVGGGIAKLGSAKGRGELAQSIKNKASTVKRVVTNPRATINSAVTSLEESTKSAVKSGAKGLVNSALLLTPGKDSWRQKLEKNADEWIDNAVDRGVKENVKRGIVSAATKAHNLKEVLNGTPENIMTNEDMRSHLSGVKKNLNDKYVKPVTTTAKIYAEPVTDALKDLSNDVKDAVNEAVDDFKQDVEDLKEGAKDKINKLANKTENLAKNTVSGAAAMVYNDIQNLKNTPENSIDAQGMRTILSAEKEKLAKSTKEIWQEADRAPVTLQPSALISAPFKIANSVGKHATSIQAWVNDVEKLANGWENIKKAKEDKVILKKTGQIILRSAARTIKGTGQDAKKVAEGTASIFGNMLKDFGNSMQQNGSNKNKGWTSWQKMHEAEERKKAAAQEDRAYFSSIDKDNDE